jgi:hypothetical protein
MVGLGSLDSSIRPLFTSRDIPKLTGVYNQGLYSNSGDTRRFSKSVIALHLPQVNSLTDVQRRTERTDTSEKGIHCHGQDKQKQEADEEL